MLEEEDFDPGEAGWSSGGDRSSVRFLALAFAATLILFILLVSTLTALLALSTRRSNLPISIRRVTFRRLDLPQAAQ